ncbi:similar to stage IV sporulation protein [Caloramator quimbayensis]|uniref:Similar to stage IV sporulation protein n=1 Tax=Caloramator quimbayensis TaxID=1147123 RepID=A0A1T4X9X7_9CLOT|nr:sporulation protein YqfD [Caloramator quimbayensis]SKA85908.1 similar to stage IV sporulation protein [Caloramator quimbayensis]
MSKKNSMEFINGYIIVKAEGLNTEKFINMAVNNGINLWDVERIDFTTTLFKMRYYQYGMLREVVKKTGVKVKIIKKTGIHFIYKKALRRKIFILGIGVFLAIIIYMLNIIWQIEISGNKTVDSKLIYESAKNAGLKEGNLKYKLNIRDIEDSILKDIKELSVVTIRLEGTKVRIEVVERKMPPSILNLNEPMNIIAAKDGIILKVSTYMGKSLIKEGDYVKKGQILISGILTDNQNLPVRLVHAIGDVTAKTWYESVKEIDLNYKYEERTGRVCKKVYYNINDKKIYLKNDNIDFQKYDKIIDKKLLKIGTLKMPVEMTTEYYYELAYKYKTIDYDEAYKIALNEAENEIKQYLPKDVKIIDKKIEKTMGNNKVKVRLLYVAEENICLMQAIK